MNLTNYEDKSLILFIVMFTNQWYGNNGNEFISQALKDIPDLIEAVESSREAYEDSVIGFPHINFQYCESTHPFIDGPLWLEDLINLFMEETESDILQNNIVKILCKLEKSDLQKILDESEENPIFKNFLAQLDKTFDS